MGLITTLSLAFPLSAKSETRPSEALVNAATPETSQAFLSNLTTSELTTSELTTPSSSLTLDKEFVTFDVTSGDTIAYSTSFIELGANYFKDLAIAASKKVYSLLKWKKGVYAKEPAVDPYKRTLHFGRWINDPNDNLCFNTRAKVLVRDSKKDVVFKDNNHCIVDRGEWDDPYTNETLLQSRQVQIDHMVPLKNAYISGAYQWSFRNRCLYANYMGAEYHLISSDARENMRKGDRTPADYMPPNNPYACTYVKNWLSVKFLWNLKMSKTESEAIQNLIKTHHCNPQIFQMTYQEAAFQKQFMKDNLNLCEQLEKRRQAAQNP